MELTFLEAKEPLTKSISQTDIKPYPHAKFLTSYTENVKTPFEFHDAIKAHADLNHALLKGSLVRNIRKESRAGLSDIQANTEWLCLDIDGLKNYTVKQFIHKLGFDDVSHIIQYSATSGLFKDTSLKAHIFFMLDAPINPDFMNDWLTWLNFTFFAKEIKLNPAGSTLHFPIDPTLSQNSRLIFIAPPTFDDKALDPHPQSRISIVKCKTDKLSIPDVTILPTRAKLQTEYKNLVKKLRKQEGFPETKTPKFATSSLGHEVCSNPESARVTGVKADRGFIYLNLNGGNSWGYYHPENNYKYIYNFKGEPVYPTEKFLPEYWRNEAIPKQSVKTPSPDGHYYFGFQDEATGKLFYGAWNPTTLAIQLTNAGANETAVRRFLKHKNKEIDMLPVWRLTYDPRPNATIGIDTKIGYVNSFQPPSIPAMRSTHKKKGPPQSFMTFIEHVVNYDADVVQHFINWIAYVVQFRTRCNTAWLLFGTHGTGKGVLFSNILRPLVGEQNASLVTIQNVAEKFTDTTDNKTLVMVDEVSRNEFKSNPGLMNRIKAMVTDDTTISRKFNSPPIPVDNHCNFIFTSNEIIPMDIPPNDRRFNVAPPQRVPIKETMKPDALDKLINRQIPIDLPEIYSYFLQYKTDPYQARTCMENPTKAALSNASVTATGDFFERFRSGDAQMVLDEYEFFKDQANWSSIMNRSLQMNKSVIEDFNKLCEYYFIPAQKHRDKHNKILHFVLDRDEVATLTRCMLGINENKSPHHFKAWTAQYNVAYDQFRCVISNTRKRGIRFGG